MTVRRIVLLVVSSALLLAAIAGSVGAALPLEQRAEGVLSAGASVPSSVAKSPSGLLLFACSGCPGDPTLFSSVFTLSTDGRLTRIARLGRAQDPRWSPDGRRIAYSRNGDEIWVSAADGTKARRVTRPSSRFQDQWPTWFPDGKRLTFHRLPVLNIRDDPTLVRIPELWSVGVDGRQLRRVFPRRDRTSAVSGTQPEVSPDGRRIAFVRGSRIWTTDPNGTQPRRLRLPAGWGVDLARWKPDGKKLAFAMRRDGELPSGIRIMDLGTGRLRRVGGLSEDAGSQAWSPDGRWLAVLQSYEYPCEDPRYEPCVDRGPEIVLVRIADNQRLRIFGTEEAEIVSSLDWRPPNR